MQAQAHREDRVNESMHGAGEGVLRENRAWSVAEQGDRLEPM